MRTQVFEYVGAVVLSFGGSTAVLLALSTWLGKVWAGRFLEADRAKYTQMIDKAKSDLDRVTRKIQAGLDHAVFVSRAQFEVELQALRNIWRAASIVRSTLTEVRPSGSLVHLDETPEQRLQRFLDRRVRFLKAHAELVAAIDHNSAFYPIDIYEALDALRTRTAGEKSELLTRRPFESDWYDRGDAAIQDVFVRVEEVSNRIRSRMASLVVREDVSA